MTWFHCFHCRRLGLLRDSTKPSCGHCGSKNGEVIDPREVEKAVEEDHRQFFENVVSRTVSSTSG